MQSGEDEPSKESTQRTRNEGTPPEKVDHLGAEHLNSIYKRVSQPHGKLQTSAND